MVIFVIGGSGSGKSAFAENIIAESDIAKRTYIATMRVWDDEGMARVERHRLMRADKGFDTLECPLAGDLNTLPDGAVLLEDLTNLAMNQWYGDAPDTAVACCYEMLERLAKSARLFVIVGNDIFADGIDYGEEMCLYLAMQGAVNTVAASVADRVFEVRAGIAHEIIKTNFSGGAGVTLIIGGKHQGKLEYAKKISPETEIFDGLEAWLREETAPFEVLEAMLLEKPNLTIICDEVGCGIVPLEASQREWRERVGRVCVWLGGRATRVIRMSCGIPTILKDNEL